MSPGSALMRIGSLRLLVLVAIAVSLALTLWLAVQRPRGDFFATLPGGYVRTLNPSLWDSPDLRDSWAFHKRTYLHGPIQFLTLYPLGWLDSYRQIAAVLLPVYAVALWLACRVMQSAIVVLTGRRDLALPVFASLALFVPVLQAYAHREFEVVMLLAFAIGLWCLLTDRRGWLGIIIAYAAWFKYIPLLFIGYFGIRGWGRAIATFVLASAAILGASHFLFGLQNFFNNNVPDHASQAFNFTQAAFCEGWTTGDETLSSVRQGLCRLQDASGVSLARNSYVVICLGIAAAFLITYVRLVSRRLSLEEERWRRAFEFSIVTTVSAAFFFGHYYYLSALWIPLAVLLARYATLQDTVRWRFWALAYFLLSLSAAPLALLSWALGRGTWYLYMRAPIYLYGDLLLVAMLLREYAALAQGGAHLSQSAKVV